jgi:LPS sulfotransferase NodH
MNTQICLLLAAERSGTHLLRSMLSTAPDVDAPGEICNAAQQPSGAGKFSFLKFRERACRLDSQFFFPSLPVQKTLLDQYFDFVRNSNEKTSMVVLDVKYSHVHNFNAFWWDLVEPPYLLQYARKNRFKIIHLIRRKVYRTAVSGLYAHASGVWRARSPEELKHVQITADRPKLDKRVRQIVYQIALFERWLHRCDAMQISYEDLTENADPLLLRLRDFLALETQFENAPGFLKTTPPLEEVILNLSDISDVLDVDWNDAHEKLARRRSTAPERKERGRTRPRRSPALP